MTTDIEAAAREIADNNECAGGERWQREQAILAILRRHSRPPAEGGEPYTDEMERRRQFLIAEKNRYGLDAYQFEELRKLQKAFGEHQDATTPLPSSPPPAPQGDERFAQHCGQPMKAGLNLREGQAVWVCDKCDIVVGAGDPDIYPPSPPVSQGEMRERPDASELAEAESRLKDFARRMNRGSCRIMSEGSRCTCLLCDIDRLSAAATRWKKSHAAAKALALAAARERNELRDLLRQVKDHPLFVNFGKLMEPIIVACMNRYEFSEFAAQKEAEVYEQGNGVELIAAERRRQIEVEGWTPEHDDEHDRRELQFAAASYVLHAANHDDPLPRMWPWDHKWWKPSDDPVRNLVKAGALIAAEIDRLRRLPRKPTEYEQAGFVWWNEMSKEDRRKALEAAGPNASAADAYRHYLASQRRQPEVTNVESAETYEQAGFISWPQCLRGGRVILPDEGQHDLVSAPQGQGK